VESLPSTDKSAGVVRGPRPFQRLRNARQAQWIPVPALDVSARTDRPALGSTNSQSPDAH
jgi:hypothetical protein